MTSDPRPVVLVVDDDTDIREAIGMALERFGYEVLLAENGADAFRVMRAHPRLPCVILLDLMMPVMDGMQFREAQLADARFAAVPLVVLSGHGQVAAFASKLRADEYFEKPIDLLTLRDVVGRFVR
jgi:CheY-like chemotaxis protein